MNYCDDCKPATTCCDKCGKPILYGIGVSGAELGPGEAEIERRLLRLVNRNRLHDSARFDEPNVAAPATEHRDDRQSMLAVGLAELGQAEHAPICIPHVGRADGAADGGRPNGDLPEVVVQLEGDLVAGLIHESSKLPDPTTPAIETIRSDDRMSSDA